MSRLLVLGNAGLDISLPLPRLPHPGESLVGGARSTAPGGKGLNQAVVAARIGLVPVRFHAPLGNDAEADMVEAALQAEAFASLELPRQPGPTDLSILLVLPDAENCVVGAGTCAAGFPVADAARSAATVQPGEWLLLQGNLTEAATAAALQAADGRTMLNTAPLLWDATPLLPLCDVVVANAVEAQQITGLNGPAAATWLLAAGARQAVVTMGAAGCVVAGPDGVAHHPAPTVQPVDTTGAGDTFCGVLAVMLAAGCDMARSISAAQRAAAVTVQRPGAFAALPSAAELRAIICAAER